MAKLYFRYGTVGSAKTMNLLAVAHNYKVQRKSVLLIKPAMDTRFGKDEITSRAGLTAKADLLVDETSTLNRGALAHHQCILADEAQFLPVPIIDELRDVATEMHIPVICYGLRSDFRRQLFPAAQRLLELADAIEEIKTTCWYCNRKAIYNLKLQDGQPTLAGPTVQLGTEETYLPTCASCYKTKLIDQDSET